jgi:hypothetical protein
MTPKTGQVAKFHTPLPDENPNQIYVVLEIIENDIRPRADIQALDTGLPFPPINTVLLKDLEVVEVESSDMIGHYVTINKSDYSQATGKVISVQDQKISLNLQRNYRCRNKCLGHNTR